MPVSRKSLSTAVAALVVAAAAGVASAAEQCSISPFPQVVLTNQLLPFTITPPEFQSCDSVEIAVGAAPSEGTLMAVGSSLLYQAPAYETDDVASLVVKCPATGLSCELLVGFLVSAPPTTVPPTTASTGAPTTAGPTTTTAAPLPYCTAGVGLNVTVGLSGVVNTALPAKLPGCAGITTYRSDPANVKGRVYVNLVGSVLVVGSQFETLDSFNIIASCDAVKVCNAPVSVVSYVPLTAPPTSTIAPPPTACPNIYYYEAPIGAVFSSSLRDMPGQPSCSFGRAFTLIANPPAGTLNLALNGDFTYEPPTSEGWAEFSFNLNCMGAISCVGTARMLVTKSIAVLPISTAASTTAPSVPFVSDGFTTCKGTCNEQAWKVLPGVSLIWDTDARALSTGVAAPRADAKPVGAVGVDFINGTLVLKGYSQIGSLAARFLTFEPVADFTTGKDASLASFLPKCLGNQPQIGFSEEVWRWQSLANKTGYVGIRYNAGTSYYHKFGGKHIGCDTFAANPCRYAPLLTPNTANWAVDIDGCDVTWTGKFNISSLVAMRNTNMEKIFYYTSNKDVQGVVYSEAATAKSWLEPALGVATSVTPHQLSMTFDTAVDVKKLDTATPFTLDAQYYEYTADNGDKAFGLNILFFSQTSATGTSFTPDRHVKGFRFLKTEWRGPNRDTCPTCSGTSAVCTVAASASESAFTGNFSQGTCANGLGVVTLKKGPAMGASDCADGSAAPQPRNRIGFSAPAECSSAFQNLTIRGTAAGSRNTNTPFNFEGLITLQLLLDNGARPTVTFDLSSYVARVAIDQGLKGSLEVCRASPYWPVYDPIGDSLPDAPHKLWKRAALTEHAGIVAAEGARYMCIDQNDMRFGPTGWAVFSLDAPGLDASSIVIDSIFVQIPSEERPVYLMYRDPTSGQYVEPSADMLFWKRTHPFLNFRFITNASKMSRSSGVDIPATTTFGFAFTPGAFNIDSSMVVSAVVRSTTLNADGTYTTGAATFRRTIYIDPLLSALTRYGAATVDGSKQSEEVTTWTYELGLAAAITIGIIFVGLLAISADEDRKLPKWMPRATVIRDIPILGGVVVGGGKKKAAVGANGAPKYDPSAFKTSYDAALGPSFNA